MDFHELVLTVKYSSNKGLNKKSNSCNDGVVVSAEGETFGTSFELEASSQKNKGTLEVESIVRAASTRVRFRLLTTPFCSGVLGVEV
ncbi:hypothetical protein Tco_1123304 [Tanacetum coccineum]|uniref:Uncharacterized protein n=1 Tax=Tanacetum coccineum TaxID=301880 RepID=A0ABQ5J390_9ASTR